MRTHRPAAPTEVRAPPAAGAVRAPSPPAAVLHLQRRIGNRAVTQVIARRPLGAWSIGMRLGRNWDGVDVHIVRAVGSSAGYDAELQARAVARLAGADPGAVVQWSDGRWHAFEVSADFEMISSESDHPFRAVRGLPPAIDAELDELPAGSERTKRRAAAVLGVSSSSVDPISTGFDRKSGRVNITAELEGKEARGRHGRESHQGEDFDAGVPTAFELALDVLKDPGKAQTTLFHEVSHVEDYEFTQSWVATYMRETRRPFHRKVFKTWIDDQVLAKRLTPGEAQLVTDIAFNVSATTEARAYVRTFIAAMEAGAPGPATKSLVSYAEFLASGEIAAPPGSSPLTAELVNELRALRTRLPSNLVRHYDAAITKAKAANPSSWLAAVSAR